MSGNGGDNAHNSAFGGGKNPGMGNTGSGSNSGSSGSGNTGSHFNGPAVTYGPDGSPRINLSDASSSQPGGSGGNNGGDRGGNSGSQ